MSRSSHLRSRGLRALASLVLLAAAACGGDSPTDGNGSAPLRLAATTARPSSVVTGWLRGASVPADGMSGELGGVPVVAGRLDDSTLAFMVPAAVEPGTRELRLAVDGRTLTASLEVTAPVAVADPEGYVDSVFTGLERTFARADSAALAAPPAGADTAARRRASDALRGTLAALRQDFAAASPAERAEVARLLAANPRVLEASVAADTTSAAMAAASSVGAGVAMAALGDQVCVGGDSCVRQLDIYLDGFAASALTVAGIKVGLDVVGTAAGLPARIASGVAGAATVGYFLYSKHLVLIDRLLVPMIGSIVADEEASLRAADGTSPASAQASAQGPVTAGRPAAVNVTAEYRSLTTGDLSGMAAAAALARTYAAYLDVWERLADFVPFFDLPAPRLGTTPARTTRRMVPPAQLAVASASPAPWTATAEASGDLWLVTFANAQAGADHEVTLGIRYRPPGLPEQLVTRTMTVFPTTYGVKSVTLGPVTPRVIRGGTLQLTALVRDSVDRALTGRTVTWASGATAKATVSATGLVTGVDSGTVAISATVDGVRGEIMVTVVAEPLPLSARSLAKLGGSSPWHTCALQESGAAFCWGGNMDGQLGIGTTSNEVLRAVPVTGGHAFASLAVGFGRTCGLLGDGRAYCWGSNGSGRAGTGTTAVDEYHAPTAVATGTRFSMLALGGDMTCGLALDGRAWCWGSALYTGTGATESGELATPTAVSGGRSYSRLSAGDAHACALSGGQAWCWGTNLSDVLGDSAWNAYHSVVPYAPPSATGLVEIAAGKQHTCALRTTGEAVCWGYNQNGVLGRGTLDEFTDAQARPVAGGRSFVQLATSGHNTCGLTAAGEAWCWGYNDNGQLGDGTTTSRGAPVRVQGTHVWRSVTPGGSFTCGVTTGDEVYCWGSRSYLGIGPWVSGASFNVTTPTRVTRMP